MSGGSRRLRSCTPGFASRRGYGDIDLRGTRFIAPGSCERETSARAGRIGFSRSHRWFSHIRARVSDERRVSQSSF